MSKYVKDLITTEFKQRLDGVDDALLVNVIGMPNEQNVALRRQLRQKNIHLMVVKNSLARRATEGTSLAPAFEGVAGHAGRAVGRRRHGVAGQGSRPDRRRQGVRAVLAARRRDGRPEALGRPR